MPGGGAPRRSRAVLPAAAARGRTPRRVVVAGRALASFAGTTATVRVAAQEARAPWREAADVMTDLALPREAWRQIWSTKPLERRSREPKQRTDVVGGIFPTEGDGAMAGRAAQRAADRPPRAQR